MGISFTQILLGSISYGLGYYMKARFEINQEELIVKLKRQIVKFKKDDEEEKRELRYQLSQSVKDRDFLEREFLEFKERVKEESFNSIQKEKDLKSSSKNVLKSFL